MLLLRRRRKQAGERSSSHTRILLPCMSQAQVPLGTLGERMPNLQQLKLSGSSLPSIRELGTSLRNLQILWLCRCLAITSVARRNSVSTHIAAAVSHIYCDSTHAFPGADSASSMALLPCRSSRRFT